MGTQAQQPPQQAAPQPYNFGTNAGPNAYGYGSAPPSGAAPPAAPVAQATGTGGARHVLTPGHGRRDRRASAGAFPGTGAANTPNAPLGTGQTARSFVDPAGAFNDPETAVTQAMIELGINPLRGGPAVATVLSQAKDLVNSLMINALNTGNDLMATPNGFADALRGQVQKALQGGGVFYRAGPGGRDGAAAGARHSRRMGQGPSTSGLGGVLASQMQNASSAANMMQSLLYAGGNPAGRQAVSAWTQMVPLIMGQMLNQAPQTFAPNQYGNAPTALDVLQQILNYRAPQAGGGLVPALQQGALPAWAVGGPSWPIWGASTS